MLKEKIGKLGIIKTEKIHKELLQCKNNKTNYPVLKCAKNALPDVAQLVGHHPAKWKVQFSVRVHAQVSGLVLSWGT